MPQPGRKATLEDRFEKLERTGRRCVGDNRCERNAAFILTLVAVDPNTGEDRGEPADRKLCPRHRKFYGDDIRSGYRIVAETGLPPIESFAGLRRVQERQQIARDKREMRERRKSPRQD